ncbi:MAG: FAD-dependent oxidoreductase [Candidatus Midichloria mitochondrii]|uniref:FAD-dependent oxidoreductase n=1 Tax=Candidatus Midichloria mitochondrii TaxID=234827 RepID=UPI0011D207A8|nr:FAD-dependent oxidoreductase [Candidatus Midichloria mitochondrii]MDJ1256795.1 FAD-dependent oxidoreductase [Candidatus Midichloria mitochondrii]MDJ1288528.1 FAD-dependent oxidoreductase [Candidatus Midichloria mitochondrii]MDJ1299364.1 FAD-dependent oxidoreductase [Candidatus Midichloria mitochondrii]MDJ1313481.1 FAD-dependent oxidoreductase [Candidatus Midichloria mitochondrii]
MNITIVDLDAIQQEFSSEPIPGVMQKYYSIYKEPIQCHWHNDLFSMGSYSGYSTAISKELDNITQHNGTYYKTMFLPVQNSMFFVGEHTTILECIGTMEAAVESGERIACAIIKRCKK